MGIPFKSVAAVYEQKQFDGISGCEIHFKNGEVKQSRQKPRCFIDELGKGEWISMANALWKASTLLKKDISGVMRLSEELYLVRVNSMDPSAGRDNKSGYLFLHSPEEMSRVELDDRKEVWFFTNEGLRLHTGLSYQTWCRRRISLRKLKEAFEKSRGTA